jgi:hypothetical protein
MNLLLTTLIAIISELSSPGPGYVVYPVNDIINDPPRFNDSPDFELRGNREHRGHSGRFGKRDDEKREEARGFSQDETEMIEMIRTLIEEELKARKIEAQVFFFRGNFIVRVAQLSDMKKLESSHKKDSRKRNKRGSRGKRNQP